MTGIEQRIADVVAKHHADLLNEGGWACGWKCGGRFDSREEHDAHVAALVVEALQLTEETQFRHAFGQGDDIERRWVTGWEKAE